MATWRETLGIWRHDARTESVTPAGSRSFGIDWHVGGVPCSIRPSWWLLCAGVGLAFAVLGVGGAGLDPLVAAFAAVWLNITILLTTLVHELGHAFLGARVGLRATKVVILWLGGLTSFEERPTRPRQKAISAIGGPAANVLLGLVFVGAGLLVGESVGGTAGRILLFGFAAVNGLFAAANLLPILPQDGGLLLESAIWARAGDPIRAQRLTWTISLWLSGAVLALGCALLVGSGSWLAPALIVQGALTLAIRVTSRAQRAPSRTL